MKKGLSILLAGVMVTSLFGCGFNEPNEQVKLKLVNFFGKTRLKMN